MPSCIHKHAFADDPRKGLHPVTHGKLAPSRAPRIAKNLAFRVFINKSADNLQSAAVKVNNTLCPLPLTLFGREHNPLTFWLKMPLFNMSSLLRPTTGEPAEGEKFVEGIAFRNQGNHLLEILRLHIDFSTLRHRLWNLTQQGAFKVAHFNAPVIYPLDSNDCTALVVVSPPLFRVHPFGQVIGFQPVSGDFCDAGEGQKVVKIIGVPFARTRRTMFAVPSRELRDQRVYCKSVFHKSVNFMEPVNNFKSSLRTTRISVLIKNDPVHESRPYIHTKRGMQAIKPAKKQTRGTENMGKIARHIPSILRGDSERNQATARLYRGNDRYKAPARRRLDKDTKEPQTKTHVVRERAYGTC